RLRGDGLRRAGEGTGGVGLADRSSGAVRDLPAVFGAQPWRDGGSEELSIRLDEPAAVSIAASARQTDPEAAPLHGTPDRQPDQHPLVCLGRSSDRRRMVARLLRNAQLRSLSEADGRARRLRALLSDLPVSRVLSLVDLPAARRRATRASNPQRSCVENRR